ncbi:MAG: glutathione peroxidase [Bacilli bacterium]|nr:glutathione peroxidase [Bacilli bacterium]
MSNIYDISVKNRKGEDVSLADFKNKILLIVNTATGCGFTPQYKGLEELYEKYHDKGFEVLDFPCDQFGHQAPGDNDQIHEFCTAKYKTQFDQFAKIEVNGENEDKLFTYLKSEMPDEEIKGLKAKMAMKAIEKISKTTKNPGDIKWNFTKFLVDKNGRVIKRYCPTTEPIEIEEDIVKLLGE